MPFHPGIDDLLNYIIDLAFKRFLSKDAVSPSAQHLLSPLPSQSSLSSSTSYVQPHSPFYADSQFVTELYAEVIGVIAQSRFTLVKRRFHNEFTRLKLNISPMQQQQQQQQSTVSGVGQPTGVNMTSSTSNLSSSVGMSTSSGGQHVFHHQQSLSNLNIANSGGVNSFGSLATAASTNSVSSSASMPAGVATTVLSSQLSGSQLILTQASSSSTSTANSTTVLNSAHSSAMPIPGVNGP